MCLGRAVAATGAKLLIPLPYQGDEKGFSGGKHALNC